MKGLISTSRVGNRLLLTFDNFASMVRKTINKYIVSCFCYEMIPSIFKMNHVGTYAYFQLEVLHFYQIYRDFLMSLCHFPMLTPLQYWQTPQVPN